MIKNIIFDVGNVLIKWTPETLSHQIFEKEHEASVAANNVFRSPLWPEFDLGALSEEEIINRIKATLPKEDGYIVDKAISTYAHLVPIYSPTNNWAIKMKNKGYKLFILSNFGEQFVHTLDRLPIKPYLDGYVYSASVQMVKPHQEIFEFLLKKYNLKPEECLFIDDIKENTDAALKAGFGKVITFNGDVAQLEDFDN